MSQESLSRRSTMEASETMPLGIVPPAMPTPAARRVSTAMHPATAPTAQSNNIGALQETSKALVTTPKKPRARIEEPQQEKPQVALRPKPASTVHFGNFASTLNDFAINKHHHDTIFRGRFDERPVGSINNPSVFRQTSIPKKYWVKREGTINPAIVDPPRAAKQDTTGRTRARVNAESDVGAPSAAFNAVSGRFQELMFPSTAPVGRDEVVSLAKVLDDMLTNVDVAPLIAASGSRPRKGGKSLTASPPPKPRGSTVSVQSARRSSNNTTASGEPKKMSKSMTRMIFENGADPATIDNDGNVVVPEPEPFNHKNVRAAQESLTNVLMVGWMEIVRQTYAHSAERGVLLEKIRLCFADLLQNAYDIADFYQRRVDDIEQMGVDQRIHDLHRMLQQRDDELGVANLKIEELQQTIEAFEPEKEELERLKNREVQLNQFLTQQIDRNAQLITMQAAAAAAAVGGAGGAGVGPLDADSRSMRSGHSRRKSKRSMGGGSDRSRSLAAGDIASGSRGDFEELLDEFDDDYYEDDGEWTEDDGTTSATSRSTAKKVEMVDCIVQVDGDKAHDDALYLELSNMAKHLETVTNGTDALAHTVYGEPDVANPSIHASMAIGRLEDIASRAIAAQEKFNNEHTSSRLLTSSVRALTSPKSGGDSPGGRVSPSPAGGNSSGSPDSSPSESKSSSFIKIPPRGFLEITKPLVTGIVRDTTQALKQLVLRVETLREHRGLQRALTDPLKPPKLMSEPCKLCERIGVEPKIIKAAAELDKKTEECHRLTNENKSVIEQVISLKKQVEHFRNSMMNAAAAARKHSVRRKSSFAPGSLGSSNTSPTHEKSLSRHGSKTFSQSRQSIMFVSTDPREELDAALAEALALPAMVDANVNTEITLHPLAGMEPPAEPTPRQPEPTPAPAVEVVAEARDPSYFKRSRPMADVAVGGQDLAVIEEEASASVMVPQAPSGNFFVTQPTQTLAEDSRASVIDALTSPIEIVEPRSSSPPLKLELVINCRCLSEGYRSPKDSGTTTPRATLRFGGVSGHASPAPSPRAGDQNSQREMDANRKADLDSRVQRLRELMLTSDPFTSPRAVKSLQWTIKQISLIYHSKATSDHTHATENMAPLTCAEHLVDTLKQTYGTRKLVEEQTQQLLRALQKHNDDVRVELFGCFLTEVYSAKTYAKFIHLYKSVEDSITVFENLNTHTVDDETKPSRIGMECAIYVAMQVFRGDERMIRRACEAAIAMASASPAGKVYRPMAVPEDAALPEIQVPADANRRDVSRGDWLRQVCDLMTDDEQNPQPEVQEEDTSTAASKRASRVDSAGAKGAHGEKQEKQQSSETLVPSLVAHPPRGETFMFSMRTSDFGKVDTPNRPYDATAVGSRATGGGNLQGKYDHKEPDPHQRN